ncbi:MAG: hypothetical protein A3E85_02715 [Gammaproteobacteria bacterium RIFCSPHIGHO2_12_FULL_45_12]|nr:MAG: hypothetical protein A3E85_02715 [Gammaproteobacteria bacterium RIFCSPHIGHO2_12_FULL_45_12]
MKLDELPIVDTALGIRLAGNKKDLANEILSLLIQTLPDDISSIITQYQNKNYTELLREVHKLHGAVCYCGLPRLKTLLDQLETHLKNPIMEDQLKILVTQLSTEATLLLEHYSSPKRP